MTVNNFELAKNGVSIEANIFYDIFKSKERFDENLLILQDSSYKKNSILAYSIEGNVDVSNLKKGYDVNISEKSLILKYSEFVYEKNIEFISLKEIKDVLTNLNYNNDILPLKNCHIDTLLECILEDLGGCQETFHEFMGLHFDPDFVVIETRGFNQGDYNKVVFYKDVLDYIRTEMPGYREMTNQEIANDFKENISNFCWSTPISGYIKIDDEIYNVDEYVDSEYSYDKNSFLSSLEKFIDHEKKLYIMDWLENNLPDDPKYID